MVVKKCTTVFAMALALVVGGTIGFAWPAPRHPTIWTDIRTWASFAVAVVGVTMALVVDGQHSGGAVPRNVRHPRLFGLAFQRYSRTISVKMQKVMSMNQQILVVVRIAVGIAGVVAGSLAFPTGRVVPSARAVPLALIIVGAIFAAQAILDLAWEHLSKKDAAAAGQEAGQTGAGAFAAARAALDLAWADLSGNGEAGVARTGAGALAAARAALDLAWADLSRREAPASGQAEAAGPQTAVGVFVAAIATVLGLLAVFGASPTFAVRLGAPILVIGAIIGLMLLLYVAYGIGGLATASLIAWITSILFGTTAFGLACMGPAVFFR